MTRPHTLSNRANSNINLGINAVAPQLFDLQQQQAGSSLGGQQGSVLSNALSASISGPLHTTPGQGTSPYDFLNRTNARSNQSRNSKPFVSTPPAPSNLGENAQSVYSRDTQNSWANMMRSAGFPESAISTGLGIIQAESGGRPEAVNNRNANGSVDSGLFQINSIHRNGAAQGLNLFDPNQNIKAAYNVWKQSGGSWTPWVTYNSGKYRDFVPSATVTKQGMVGSTATGEVRKSITSKAISVAMSNIPYVWGGNSLTKGVDCSGLVQQVYGLFGIKMPRMAYQQAATGVRTPLQNLAAGDLVAFQGGHLGPNYVGHIAIYIGNGKIAEAPGRGINVRVRSINSSDLKRAFGVHLSQVPG
jgi:cell wall-associated NlpC family hydrolase